MKQDGKLIGDKKKLINIQIIFLLSKFQIYLITNEFHNHSS